MNSDPIYDVVVVGGGPVGLASAYQVAKEGKSVVVLEQRNFFNQAGSSGDMARMFRTMYTENFMADIAVQCMDMWDDLERDAGTTLRLMSGLLNFGDKDLGQGTPEGTLLGPIPNLKRHNMSFKMLSAAEIEKRYPFTNLPSEWEGVLAPDNGIIDVQLLVRTLLRLARDYGARAQQNVSVKGMSFGKHQGQEVWTLKATKADCSSAEYYGKKIVITPGAYANHVLQPSFEFSLDLDIWEMVATYFNVNAGPQASIFPTMWFLFAPDKPNNQSQLFYGFPALPWGPSNVVRIAVDAATRRIKDPNERQANVINPDDIKNCQEFIAEHVVGVDPTVPAYSLTCLMTNVFDNMFVLDFVPEKYLKGGPKDSVVIFTAGWAMKFVPLLGIALKDMALHGSSEFARPDFSILRTDPKTGKGIIIDGAASDGTRSAMSSAGPAKGSSMRSVKSVLK